MPTVEGVELKYKSRPFELRIETTGEIDIEKDDQTGIYGKVPLRHTVPGGILESEGAEARCQITEVLGQLMGWEMRRLLTRLEDRALEFMYLKDNQSLKAKIEEGEFRPVYLKHFNTHDLNMPFVD